VTPARPVVGEVTTFEADGAIAGAGDTYTWDFGDGTVGDGATTQHVFASAGPYRVSLRVLSGGVEIHASGLDLDVAHATVAEARAAR
jgi:chitodextrinase